MLEKVKDLIRKARLAVKKAFKTTGVQSISKFDLALYKFLKGTKLDIILPTTGIVLTVYMLMRYFEYVVLFIISMFVLIIWLTPQEESIDYEERYYHIRDTVYLALTNIDTILPTRKLQSILDVVHLPKYIPDKIPIYLYKMEKTTYERLDRDKLDFAIKIIQSEMDKIMDEYEELYGDGSTYYNDLRLITVTKIIDYGTYFQLQVINVDNEIAYEIAIKQLTKTKLQTNIAHTKDGDF